MDYENALAVILYTLAAALLAVIMIRIIVLIAFNR